MSAAWLSRIQIGSVQSNACGVDFSTLCLLRWPTVDAFCGRGGSNSQHKKSHGGVFQCWILPALPLCLLRWQTADAFCGRGGSNSQHRKSHGGVFQCALEISGIVLCEKAFRPDAGQVQNQGFDEYASHIPNPITRLSTPRLKYWYPR